MEIINSFIVFINNIFNITIFDNITLLEIIIYILLVNAIIKIIKVATKGGKK